MSDDWDLFSAMARNNDPATARAAATTTNARGAMLKVLRALYELGPRHADAICAHIDPDGRRWPTYKSALSRCIKAGLVAPTGHEQLSLLNSPQRIVALTVAGTMLLRREIGTTEPL